MKLATIDIGSNAARVLIVDVVVNKQGVAEFNKLNFLRLPLRLGLEVFETGEIGEQKAQELVNAMKSFQSLLTYYNVKHLKTGATSAMRDAKNNKKIVEQVEQEAGIKIKILSGDEEATIFHEAQLIDMDKEHGYLYVNVGGGSTEIVFFVEGKVHYKTSVNIGTLRILKDLVKEEQWDSLKNEIKTNVKCHLPVVMIGSGGNINKIFSLSKKKEGKPLSLEQLKEYHKVFKCLSVEDRMHLYQLREDRADVIVPALQIYINLMRWADISDIYVPQIGLVDGLARALYQEIVNKA